MHGRRQTFKEGRIEGRRKKKEEGKGGKGKGGKGGGREEGKEKESRETRRTTNLSAITGNEAKIVTTERV